MPQETECATWQRIDDELERIARRLSAERQDDRRSAGQRTTAGGTRKRAT